MEDEEEEVVVVLLEVQRRITSGFVPV